MPTKWFFVTIPFAGFLVMMTASLIAERGMDWYRTLVLPPWTPPGAVIGFAWSVIFLLTTLSLMLVWMRVPRGGRFQAIVATFLANATLYVLWTGLFFGAHLLSAATVASAGLLLSILLLLILIAPASRAAALLLVPYAGWVTLATALAYRVSQLND